MVANDVIKIVQLDPDWVKVEWREDQEASFVRDIVPQATGSKTSV